MPLKHSTAVEGDIVFLLGDDLKRLLEWEEKDFMTKGMLLIVGAAVKGDVFGPGVCRAHRINLFWNYFDEVKAGLKTLKNFPCGWKSILSLNGAWWKFLVCLVDWDVALLEIEVFTISVPVYLLCGHCCLLGDLMVGKSVAAVVACGVHVFFVVVGVVM